MVGGLISTCKDNSSQDTTFGEVLEKTMEPLGFFKTGLLHKQDAEIKQKVRDRAEPSCVGAQTSEASAWLQNSQPF